MKSFGLNQQEVAALQRLMSYIIATYPAERPLNAAQIMFLDQLLLMGPRVVSDVFTQHDQAILISIRNKVNNASKM